jgi:butyryl-CoA dehydrogenase
MNFRLTDEQAALRDAARKYARDRLPALAAKIEESGEPPSRELVREYASMGFLGVNVGEAYGGLGLGNLEALLVIEEFAKISSAVAFPVFESCVGPVRAIERFASESLKRRVVPAVCRGEKVIETCRFGCRPGATD